MYTPTTGEHQRNICVLTTPTSLSLIFLREYTHRRKKDEFLIHVHRLFAFCSAKTTARHVFELARNECRLTPRVDATRHSFPDYINSPYSQHTYIMVMFLHIYEPRATSSYTQQQCKHGPSPQESSVVGTRPAARSEWRKSKYPRTLKDPIQRRPSQGVLLIWRAPKNPSE